MRQRTKLLYGVPLAAIAILFTTTDPNALPPLAIAATLAAIALLFYGLVTRMIRLVAARALSENKQRALSLTMTAVLGLMLVLQATGQLTLRDFVSTMAIFAIGWLYISRFSLKRSP